MKEWKDIPGLPGHKALEDGRIMGPSGTIMSYKISSKGYHTMSLKYNGVYKKFKVHRLIAAAFHGLDLFKMDMEVDHIDDNKSHNHKNNLRVLSSYDHKIVTEEKRMKREMDQARCTKSDAATSDG